VWFIIFEFSFVSIAVGVAFHASSIPVVVEPLALVQACSSVNANTEAVSFAPSEFSLKTRVFVLLDAETFLLL
jgi:hypothetical protein